MVSGVDIADVKRGGICGRVLEPRARHLLGSSTKPVCLPAGTPIAANQLGFLANRSLITVQMVIGIFIHPYGRRASEGHDGVLVWPGS